MAGIAHQVVVPLRPHEARIFFGRQLDLVAAEWKLSPRETQILDRVLCAFTDRTIAEQLGLSVRTVNRHLRSLLFKAGVATRAALVSRTLDPEG